MCCFRGEILASSLNAGEKIASATMRHECH
jgi:hypothetical protein